MDNETSKQYQQQQQQTNQIVHKEEKQQQQYRQRNTPGVKTVSNLFATNKNGLPFEVQRLIVANIKHFRGLDDFVRESCDKNYLLFGKRNSTRRKAVLSRRKRLIEIRDNQPKRFLDICNEFDLHTDLEEDIATPSIASEETAKQVNWKNDSESYKELSPKMSFSKFKSPNKFLALTNDIDSCTKIREYELNLNEAEDNPNGFTVHLLPTFQFNNEYIDAIVMTKTIPDMEDMIGADKVSMSLLECGTKFLVQEPSISRFMCTNDQDSYSGFANQVHLFENVMNMHEMLLSQIEQDESRRTKKYILKLPDGYKCKMGYMNPNNGERLTGVLHYTTTTLAANLTGLANDVDCMHPTVSFVVVLDNEERFIRKHAEVDNEFTNLFQRMQVQNARTNTPQRTESTNPP